VSRSKSADVTLQTAIVVAASLLVAVCARFSLPIPGTPVPLSMQNFGVLLVGLSLGSRRGFIVLALYLAEGVAGLPVFAPVGAPGILRFLGPTAGYLIAYPFVAALAGYIFERRKRTFTNAALAAIAGELLLFVCGISWLYVLTHSLSRAIAFGLYWFIFAEVMKVMFAAGIAVTWRRFVPQP
ncbi:MAG: biotin transporter BioY, partial [Acidobacteria bacterium]